ncbi:hypothetical protein ACNOYE_34690 [Nannocystaceae bacterium ST9]
MQPTNEPARKIPRIAALGIVTREVDAVYFKSFAHERVLVIRWVVPSIAGAGELSKLIERCHAAVNERIFFAAIVGAKCPTPSSEAREAMRVEHERVSELLIDSRTVILGRSIRQSLMRSVLLNISLINGRQPRRFATDGTAEEFAAVAHSSVGVDPNWLLRQLLDVGVLEAEELAQPLAAAGSS